MRPRVQAWPLLEWASDRVIMYRWQVYWSQDGRMKHETFWTWPAALDFAMELVAEFRHRNHLHLWK